MSLNSGNHKGIINGKDKNDDLNKKIYFDSKELASEKIVKIWENFDNDDLAQSINWIKFHWLLKIINFRKIIGMIKRKLAPSLWGLYG